MVLSKGAMAGDEDTPLSLSLAQYLNHDSNFSKDDNNKSTETTATSVVQLGLNKSYGRQTYQASAKLSAQRYKNNNQLNNDGKDVSGTFTTELFRDWLVTANGSYDEALNAIQNNVGIRVSKNIRKYRDGGLSVQYGNGGTWATVASYDSNKQDYSLDTQKYQNANQHSTGLRAVYSVSDVLNYSLGVRHVVTDYPSNPSYSQVADRDIDLSTNWLITGLSNFNATLTKRSTSYTPNDIAGSKGWTGAANWSFTPHGIFTYNLGFNRTTGTDRSRLDFVNQATVSSVNNDTVTTSLNASARAQLTGKIVLTATQTVTHFKIDNNTLLSTRFFASSTSLSTASYNHSTTLALDYSMLRSISLGCSYEKYSQGLDSYRLKYSGYSVGCNANFTINPLN